MTAYYREGRGWYVDFTETRPDGSTDRKRRKSPVNTRRGAEAFERELRAQLLDEWRLNRMGINTNTPTVAGFQDEFFGVLERRGLKRSTLVSYRTIMRLHLVPHFGDKELDKITPRDIEAFKEAKSDYAPKSIRNFLGVLSCLFGIARKLGVVQHTAEIDSPKLRRDQELEFWDFDEVERVLECLGSESLIDPWIRLALATGLRCGELTGLKWGDVDLERRTLVVRQQYHKGDITTPKSNKSRTIPLSAAALAALRIQRTRTYMRTTSDDDWVFWDNGFVTLDRVKRGFQRVIRRAGVKRIRLHDLRHTFASHCVMRGVPLQVVQEWLGHSDIRVTMRYAHLAQSHIHQFVELLNEPPSDVPTSPTRHRA